MSYGHTKVLATELHRGNYLGQDSRGNKFFYVELYPGGSLQIVQLFQGQQTTTSHTFENIQAIEKFLNENLKLSSK